MWQECNATARTHFMTAASLYTDAYAYCVVYPFFTPTLNMNLFILLICRAQKSFTSREDSQVAHKGRLLQRTYDTQSHLAQLHLLHSG